MEAGISIKGYFIYGFPGETKDDCQKTYELALELKEASRKTNSNFRTSVFRYRPYHGTELYHKVNNEGQTFTVKEDKKLSHVLDRQQFNFYVENFSSTPEDIVSNYIVQTNNLND